MPHRTPDPDHPDLFEHTAAGMERRLCRVRDHGQMIGALRWGMDQLDRTFDETPAGVRATVACRDGCDFCCRVPVDVQAHEVFFAADHIQVHYSPEALAGVIARLAVHRARIAAFAEGGRDASREACALLLTGSCTIYAGRPEVCRSHHTSDAAVCEAHMGDPSVDITKVYIPALRSRMFAVMLGIDDAMEASGYDDRSYDLGSALHEALTNGLCLSMWMRHRPAFPDSCLADPPV